MVSIVISAEAKLVLNRFTVDVIIGLHDRTWHVAKSMNPLFGIEATILP
jgi:hypothetical protein